jgi:methylglutaconyl-CoA hydratase
VNDDLILERRPPVLAVRLNRPDRRNAFDDGWFPRISQAFHEAAGDPDIRLVLLSGEGSAFCAGADLDWMRRAAAYTEEQNREDAVRMSAMFQAVVACPVPVVARVQGAALGGGSGLAAAADITIASRDALFGFTEVRLGILPAVISPFVLRKVPLADARRYFLTGERFDAEEAHRIGLVQELAEADELDLAVEKVVGALLAAAPGAQQEVKKLLETVPRTAAPEVFDVTAAWIARVRAKEEAKEGFRAFFEKRPPSWVPRKAKT